MRRLVLLAALGLTAAAGAPAQTVTGTATFRERMALPPGAELRATLSDVSLADAAAPVLGEALLPAAGAPPYRFAIPYDPALIVPNHSYAVRVTLLLDGRLLFTTDTMHPVLTGGAPDHVNVVMVRVAKPG